MNMIIMSITLLNAQTWDYGGDPVNGSTDWFGADNASIWPLEIRHDAGDQPIEFYTTGDAISEMWLTPTLTGVIFGGATYDLTGNLGIGPGFSMISPPMSKPPQGLLKGTLRSA